MKERLPRFDCIVIGSGPAGLAAAGKLATFGRRVAVISRIKPRGFSRLESMANRDVVSHAFRGLKQDSLPDGMFTTETGMSWWGGSPVSRPEAVLVDRPVFDRALGREVQRLGVSLIRVPGEVTEVVRQPEGWIVGAAGKSWSSSMVLDACGRHSTLRRRKYLVDWRQVAVTGQWRFAWNAPAFWIESLPEAWLWGIRHPDGRFALSMFFDAAQLRQGVAGIWRETLAISRLAALSSHWETLSPCTVCEATPVAAGELSVNAALPIGDAALARDPLASQGLTAGISDGLAAAVGVHTCLTDSSKATLVAQFFADRRRMAIVRHLRALSAAYRTVSHDSRFWTARRRTLPDAPEDAATPSISMDCPVIVSSRWSFARAGVLAGDAITEGEVLRSKESEEPVAWLEGRPIRDFLPSTGQPHSVRSIILGWIGNGITSERLAPRVFHWLAQRRILVPAS